MYSDSGGGQSPWDVAREPGQEGALDGRFGDDASTIRGVVFDSVLGDAAAGDAWGAQMSADPSAGRLPGDFYFEQDNVKRGVAQATHGVADGFGALGFGQGMEAYGGDAWGMGMECGFDNKLEPFAGLGAPLLARGSSAVGGRANDKVPEHVDFTAAVSPPAEVPFGGLSATTMTLANTNAAEAANSAHSFLTTQVTSEIRKVRIDKFAINAEVFCNGSVDRPGQGACTLKVRVFRLRDQEALKVEFRRQGGEIVIFAQVFEQAEGYMQLIFGERLVRRDASQTSLAQCAPSSAHPMQPEFSASDCTPDVDLSPLDPYSEVQPLIDALTSSGMSSNQTEAVSALATLASLSTAGAVAICTALAGVQGVLAGLISNARLDIAYPAAQLAARLAQHGPAGMAEQLLHSALHCVAADDTDKLVRLELAEAVKMAAQRVSSELAPSFNPIYCELRGQVPQLLSMPAAKKEAAVATRLTEALGALEAVERFANHACAGSPGP